MKKYILFIFILSFIIFINCAPKEAQVRIKVGVIMKSGDIKNVARQEFMITNTDLVKLWEISKKENMQDIDSIENDFKVQMDFDSKIVKLEEDKSRLQNTISKQLSPNSPEVKKIWNDLHVTLYKHQFTYGLLSIQGDLTEVEAKKLQQVQEEHFVEKYKNETSYGKAKECRDEYKIFINELLKRAGPKDVEHWKEQLEDMEKIDVLIRDQDAKFKNINDQITAISEEINSLNRTLESRTIEKFLLSKTQAINDFQSKSKEYVFKSIQTNLEGEAQFSIMKGQYFILGITRMSQSILVWNHSIDIQEKDTYIELSNDNAFSIDDEEFAGELSEAIEGFNVSSNT